MERHRQEMRGLMSEMQEASRMRDEESRQELALEQRQMEASIIRLQIDSSNLTKGYRYALMRMEERLRVAEAAAAAASHQLIKAKMGTSILVSKPTRRLFKPDRYLEFCLHIVGSSFCLQEFYSKGSVNKREEL